MLLPKSREDGQERCTGLLLPNQRPTPPSIIRRTPQVTQFGTALALYGAKRALTNVCWSHRQHLEIRDESCGLQDLVSVCSKFSFSWSIRTELLQFAALDVSRQSGRIPAGHSHSFACSSATLRCHPRGAAVVTQVATAQTARCRSLHICLHLLAYHQITHTKPTEPTVLLCYRNQPPNT